MWYMAHRIFRWDLKLDHMCFDPWAFWVTWLQAKKRWPLSGGWQIAERVFVKRMQWNLVDLLPLHHWLVCAFAVCLMLCSLQLVHDDQNTAPNYQENWVSLVLLETAQSLDDNSPSLPALSYHYIRPGFSILHPHSMRTLNSCENCYLGASDNRYSTLNSPKIKYLNCWGLSSCSPCMKTECRDGSICVVYNETSVMTPTELKEWRSTSQQWKYLQLQGEITIIVNPKNLQPTCT